MPIRIDTFGLEYFWAPKVACTSVKMFLYEAEQGRPWDPEEWNGWEVHRYWRMERGFDPEFETVTQADYGTPGDLWRFGIVRDPIKRILSAFSNRVEYHRDIGGGMRKRWQAFRSGLSTRPSLERFVMKYDEFRAFHSSIRHHTRPQSDFLGPDLGRLDAVYPIERLGDLHQELARRTGLTAPFPREQTGGRKYDVTDLSDRAYARLLEITKPEYDYLGGLYAPPARA